MRNDFKPFPCLMPSDVYCFTAQVRMRYVQAIRSAICALRGGEEARAEFFLGEANGQVLVLYDLGAPDSYRKLQHLKRLQAWRPGPVTLANVMAASEAYTVGKARYAKGMYLVKAESLTGLKSRSARLLGALKCRWTNREKGYVVSPSKLARFEKLFREGWDASFWGGELRSPQRRAS